MERSRCTVLLAIEDRGLRKALEPRLRRAGYHPQEITPEALLTGEPHFGSAQEAVIFLHAGSQLESMHRIIEHLYRNWSELGWVLLIVFHPLASTDADLFKVWGLDALWKFNTTQQLLTVNRSIRKRDWDLDDTIRGINYYINGLLETDQAGDAE